MAFYENVPPFLVKDTSVLGKEYLRFMQKIPPFRVESTSVMRKKYYRFIKNGGMFY